MLQIDSVSKLYKGGYKALDNISFSVEQGEFISVIGKSGAGKTTRSMPMAVWPKRTSTTSSC